jgi:hypothetical protein
MAKEKKNKKSITLNDCTMQLLVELSSKMGMTENAVVSVALHKLAKEV